jgi:hypothetical protein
VLKIFEINTIGELTGAFGAFAEGVGDFADPADRTAAEDFDQDFVTQRA